MTFGRRHFLAAGAGLVLPAVAEAQQASGGWTHAAYLAAMRASGRETGLNEAGFRTIQQRRQDGLRRIESYLRTRFGAADPAVLRAFAEVPREYFHYMYEGGRATPLDAWEADAKPWALGYGSALSDYLGQAYMTQACDPKPDHVVLEIGTGSGFQSSLLSRIVARQYSIEIIQPLGRAVQRIFAPLGYTNIETRVGDGFFGWPEVQGGFDTIIVTCAAQYVPPALLAQLKPGGRMLIPIGQPFRRGQFLYIYTKDEEGRVRSRKDVGVYFIPMTGEMQRRPAPPAPQTPTAARPQPGATPASTSTAPAPAAADPTPAAEPAAETAPPT
ncbi:protein-L-isoaspartate O-methyltransferase family protein [Plastoroseomonas hellenica]|uniref:Protein-L-isoaspartate O-methyltransferase n=1 Tax=Plastoroseomonas hellenica TaxID=2687306 RepID=A0ABS5ETJ9_9PROT|nr:protein-L-isoaspartate O-methyltransferase [Plastoroseomonas hellenica]MBR0642471.1 protein-L-isoaspartate O-methyltransferase [Plastoroseomonas hellenica]MBR0663619.1 protein-L-isoaspartate O-methyltransferase [Plastoroseomonas hellenica]